jgi:hypothetical protein
LQLIETGKALRAANQKGVKTIGYTHDRLQAFLPNAIDKFHLALDELETDIVCPHQRSPFAAGILGGTANVPKVRAKAVLGRDLRELQAKRSQLENPTMEQVEMADPVGDLGGPPNAFSAHDAEIEVSVTGAQVSEAIKEEESIAANPETANINSPKSHLKTSLGSPSQPVPPSTEVEQQDSMQKPKEFRGEDVQTEIGGSKNARDPYNIDTTQGLGISISDTVPSAASEAPVTADLQDATFDSMFDAGNNDDSDLNFDDFGFSGDGTGNQNDDFGGNSGDFDLSSFGNQANQDTGDPNSLLQGLDTFADGSGGEFNMLEMSNTGSNNNGVGETGADDFGMSGGDLDMALGMGANESTFDDLLDGMDFGDADDDGTGGDMMEHGEFDDAYFGLNSDG